MNGIVYRASRRLHLSPPIVNPMSTVLGQRPVNRPSSGLRNPCVPAHRRCHSSIPIALVRYKGVTVASKGSSQMLVGEAAIGPRWTRDYTIEARRTRRECCRNNKAQAGPQLAARAWPALGADPAPPFGTQAR